MCECVSRPLTKCSAPVRGQTLLWLWRLPPPACLPAPPTHVCHVTQHASATRHAHFLQITSPLQQKVGKEKLPASMQKLKSTSTWMVWERRYLSEAEFKREENNYFKDKMGDYHLERGKETELMCELRLTAAFGPVQRPSAKLPGLFTTLITWPDPLISSPGSAFITSHSFLTHTDLRHFITSSHWDSL